jgi:hypothetical protein
VFICVSVIFAVILAFLSIYYVYSACIYIAIRSSFFLSCKCYRRRKGGLTLGGYTGASGKEVYPQRIGETPVVNNTPGEMGEVPVVLRFTPGGYKSAGGRTIPPVRWSLANRNAPAVR